MRSTVSFSPLVVVIYKQYKCKSSREQGSLQDLGFPAEMV